MMLAWIPMSPDAVLLSRSSPPGFAMGAMTGIVLSYEIGTNWSVTGWQRN